eukprot:2932957-Amphidinium_carterae.2
MLCQWRTLIKVVGCSQRGVIYGEGKVEQPLAEDVQAILDIALPQHRLIKVERDGISMRLCAALLGAYSKQGVGICRHTGQRKYQNVLEACLRLAAC